MPTTVTYFVRSGYPSGCPLTWKYTIQDGRREGRREGLGLGLVLVLGLGLGLKIFRQPDEYPRPILFP